MKKKIIIIGLSPEYHNVSIKSALNECRKKMYSTNLGACYITKSLIDIFNADYYDFNNAKPELIKNNYEICILSLASHLGEYRDLSKFVDFVKAINMRTIFLSGGIDAGPRGDLSTPLHKSVLELLNICSIDGQFIGVRGAVSALKLIKEGFKNVVPIGCPTMFSTALVKINPNIRLQEPVGIPLHWSIWRIIFNNINSLNIKSIIAQDVIDNSLLPDQLEKSTIKKIADDNNISEHKIQNKINQIIVSKVLYSRSFKEWTKNLEKNSWLLSGRLHATIWGLRQGIPSILVPWDARTSEMVEYFQFPTLERPKKGANQEFVKLLENVNFHNYNNRQPLVWKRWIEFISSVGLKNNIREDLLPKLDSNHIANNHLKLEAQINNSYGKNIMDLKNHLVFDRSKIIFEFFRKIRRFLKKILK